MGLGKTIQGIGVAELLSQEAGISKVLVICPASVKSQWRLEIVRFSNRSHQIVLGSAKKGQPNMIIPVFSRFAITSRCSGIFPTSKG
jgi:SNF2 family DNA or RNA helicase